MAWASSDDRDDRKRGDGEIRRVAFLFCRFPPPHHIHLLMLFCLRLHLLAFFFAALRLELAGVHTQKRGLGCGGAPRSLWVTATGHVCCPGSLANGWGFGFGVGWMKLSAWGRRTVDGGSAVAEAEGGEGDNEAPAHPTRLAWLGFVWLVEELCVEGGELSWFIKCGNVLGPQKNKGGSDRWHLSWWLTMDTAL